MAIKELDWHTDKHFIVLQVDKTQVSVSPSVCPHGAVDTAPCWHAGIANCLVSFFISTYGLDTNHGSCPAAHFVEIAWAFDGSPWDIDSSEFLMIPVNDPVFIDWVKSVNSS